MLDFICTLDKTEKLPLENVGKMKAVARKIYQSQQENETTVFKTKRETDVNNKSETFVKQLNCILNCLAEVLNIKLLWFWLHHWAFITCLLKLS